MNLQEQIAEFEAKGCVAGGRKWELGNPPYYLEAKLINQKVYVQIIKNSHITKTEWSYTVKFDNIERIPKAFHTLESALIEALEIVKAKVIDLAKELGISPNIKESGYCKVCDSYID